MAANDLKSFAQRLKQLRMERGVSQRGFAAQAGINYVQYNRYESGERKPSADLLPKLADALGVSVDYLLEGNEENAAIADLKDRELLKLFQHVENFPDKKKEVVKSFLSEMVENQQHQEASNSRVVKAS